MKHEEIGEILAKLNTDSEVVVEDGNMQGFGFIKISKAKFLEAEGFVEINRGMVKDGCFACRRTEKAFGGQTEEVTEEVTARPILPVIDQGVAIPEKKPRATRASMYNFDDMEVGDSIHVGITEKRKSPAKSLASTVANANKKYKTEDEAGVVVVSRKFIIREVDDTDPRGPGARIFRVL